RVQRALPLRLGALPADRGAEPEEHVAREHDALAREVHEEVSRGVRGADPDEVYRDAVQLEIETVVDQRGGRTQLDAAEVPLGELGGEVRGGRIAAPGRAAQRLHELGTLDTELLGAAAVADDLGAREELVAPAVVPVAMRVDDAAGGRTPDARIGLDQRARVRQVPERVDDQPAARVDESRVAAP